MAVVVPVAVGDVGGSVHPSPVTIQLRLKRYINIEGGGREGRRGREGS